jgi:ribonuclease HI
MIIRNNDSTWECINTWPSSHDGKGISLPKPYHSCVEYVPIDSKFINCIYHIHSIMGPPHTSPFPPTPLERNRSITSLTSSISGLSLSSPSSPSLSICSISPELNQTQFWFRYKTKSDYLVALESLASPGKAFLSKLRESATSLGLLPSPHGQSWASSRPSSSSSSSSFSSRSPTIEQTLTGPFYGQVNIDEAGKAFNFAAGARSSLSQLVLWSNGSGDKKHGEDPSGIAVVYECPATHSWKSKAYLTAANDIDEVELIGLLKAMETALQASQHHRLERAVILTDSQRAIRRVVELNSSDPSPLSKALVNASQQLHSRNLRLFIHWTPGHNQIFGNELADQLSRAARLLLWRKLDNIYRQGSIGRSPLWESVQQQIRPLRAGPRQYGYERTFPSTSSSGSPLSCSSPLSHHQRGRG